MGAAVFAFLCDATKLDCPGDTEINVEMAVIAAVVLLAAALRRGAG
jgi:hypothetical protein